MCYGMGCSYEDVTGACRRDGRVPCPAEDPRQDREDSPSVGTSLHCPDCGSAGRFRALGRDARGFFCPDCGVCWNTDQLRAAYRAACEDLAADLDWTRRQCALLDAVLAPRPAVTPPPLPATVPATAPAVA